jgi:hypothetical protein
MSAPGPSLLRRPLAFVSIINEASFLAGSGRHCRCKVSNFAQTPLSQQCIPSKLERCDFKLKSRMHSSKYTMNIFYIIGVVVVAIVVAGFL